MLNFMKSRNAGKKIFVTFITLSILNYLVGCYSSDQISSAEMQVDDYKIVQAIMPDGTVINFNKDGGSFKVVPKAISGISEDSVKILLPTDEIKEIRKNIVKSVSLENLVGIKVTEVVYKNNRVYVFDDSGGVVSDDGKNIKGIMSNGYPISLNIQHIKEFHSERPELVDTADLEKIDPADIKRLVTRGNELIKFDKLGAEILYGAKIISGITDQNKFINIKADDVLYVNISKYESLQTGLLVAGIVIGVIIIVSALIPEPEPEPVKYTGEPINMSCPFVYSFDGDRYQFDAQPLGGAITKGLMRSDFSKLDYLCEENSSYKILISNEMPETQYLDEIKLYCVEHPDNSEVFTDLTGKMYLIKNPQQCISAVDEKMMDISSFITKPDNIMWQTKLPVTEEKIKSEYRNHLMFAFPKPRNAKTAHLLVNAGSSIWGSYMIKELLRPFGDQVDNWYNKIDNLDKAELKNEETMRLIVDEELYYMKINVKVQDEWREKNLIFAGGPFINETHVYDLDISDVTSDTLFIRLNPALGFWSLDYIAVDYKQNPEPVMEEIDLKKAVDNNENDITSLLTLVDDNYYIMSKNGDFAYAEFEKPSLSAEMKTTIFLKSTGYYNIHLSKQGPMQAELLYELINKPGKVVKYSLNLYEKKLALIR
jgi:hypothetical protein